MTSHEFLTRWQYVDMSKGFSDPIAIANLYAAINRLLETVPQTEPAPVTPKPVPQPPVPDKKKSWWDRLTEGQGIVIAAGIALIGTIIVALIGFIGNQQSVSIPVSPTTAIVQNVTDESQLTISHTPALNLTLPLSATPRLSGFEELQTVRANQTRTIQTEAAFNRTATFQADAQANATGTALQLGATETAARQTLVALSATPTHTPTATSTPSDTPVPTNTPTVTGTPDPLELALERARAGVTSNAQWQEWYPDGFVREFDGVEMLLVPSGCFLMGSENGGDDEQPEHERCIDEPFWIDRYEVSQAQFAAFGGEAADTNYFNGDDLPRERISWYEARDFCELREARLPTEKEWEYAASGPDNLVYPWGNAWDASRVNGDSNADDYENTAPVDAFSQGASWAGAEQMSGNVWEWVSSLYEPYPYEADDGRESLDANGARVLRGGSWGYVLTTYFRAAGRDWNRPVIRSYFYGFRCARLTPDSES